MKAYISFGKRYGENAERMLRAKTGICLYNIAVEKYDLAIASLLGINKQTNTNVGKIRTATLLGTRIWTEAIMNLLKVGIKRIYRLRILRAYSRFDMAICSSGAAYTFFGRP